MTINIGYDTYKFWNCSERKIEVSSDTLKKLGLTFYVITIIIVYSIIFFWNVKTPITYAQLEYACLNHKGDKSNFVHEVTCNDGQVINNYDSVGNDFIYNRSLEIKNLSFIEHIKYILSK